MLKELRIQNLAIIEDADLAVEPAFNVLTGETGAGKSILVDGLGLVLGERADREMVRTGCEEARIEAVFDLGRLPDVRGLLAELDVPPMEEELWLRRVIQASGKSRCAINGAPV